MRHACGLGTPQRFVALLPLSANNQRGRVNEMSAGGGRKKPRGCVRKCIDASTELLQSSPVSPTFLEKKIQIHATRRVLLGRCIDFDPILILRIPMELLWFVSDGWRVSQQKGESVDEEVGEYSRIFLLSLS